MSSAFCVCVCIPFQILNQVTDFNKILYGRYAIGGQPVT
jgi:hypothetical protein